jgi:hypothetical protein
MPRSRKGSQYCPRPPLRPYGVPTECEPTARTRRASLQHMRCGAAAACAAQGSRTQYCVNTKATGGKRSVDEECDELMKDHKASQGGEKGRQWGVACRGKHANRRRPLARQGPAWHRPRVGMPPPPLQPPSAPPISTRATSHLPPKHPPTSAVPLLPRLPCAGRRRHAAPGARHRGPQGRWAQVQGLRLLHSAQVGQGEARGRGWGGRPGGG